LLSYTTLFRSSPAAPYCNPGLLRSARADLPSRYSRGLSDSPATSHTLLAWLASLEGHHSCISQSIVPRLAGSRLSFQVQSPDTAVDTRPRLVLGEACCTVAVPSLEASYQVLGLFRKLA